MLLWTLDTEIFNESLFTEPQDQNGWEGTSGSICPSLCLSRGTQSRAPERGPCPRSFWRAPRQRLISRIHEATFRQDSQLVQMNTMSNSVESFGYIFYEIYRKKHQQKHTTCLFINEVSIESVKEAKETALDEHSKIYIIKLTSIQDQFN